jgi:hypothetical protein
MGTNQCWEDLTFWNLKPKDKGMIYVYPGPMVVKIKELVLNLDQRF